MENRFDDNEFEQFLQEETSQHRMYPSDKIWRNIHQEIHPKKSWPALTIFSLLIISALTITTILNNHPAQPFQKASIVVEVAANTTAPKKKELVEYQEQLINSDITERTFALLKEKAKQEELEAYEQIVAAENPLSATVSNVANGEVILYQPSLVSNNKASENIDKRISANNEKIENEVKKRLPDQSINLLPTSTASTANLGFGKQSTSTVETAKNNTLTVSMVQGNLVKNHFFKKPVDDAPAYEEGYGNVPSLITKKQSKFEFQVYITPSISYRKLVDDKERNNYMPRTSTTTGPTALNYNVNVNDVVRHTPAMGIEVGLGGMYKLTKSLKLKTGLQFNVRQYYIDGFATSTGLATIAIVSNNKLDTVTQYSSFSNTNGYKESQLDNKLYQVSMPIGLQWDFFQTKHVGFSVGGSIQPTLTLNKNLYIISTDYKFYTDGTPFLRRWNVNSSAELNITYKVGATKWYLGPQVRYQHLPTYTERYPIKEYRLDYGVKIGVVKFF